MSRNDDQSAGITNGRTALNKMIFRVALMATGLAFVTGAFARSDVRDGNAVVQAVQGDKYSIDGVIMGKAELFGYISDLKDREEFSGIVLQGSASEEQVRSIGSIAGTLKLKAFEQDGGDMKPIAMPAASVATGNGASTPEK